MLIEEDALSELAELGAAKTLRYAVQLLNPASHLAKIYKTEYIEAKMIKEASELFYDAKESAKILSKEGSKFMK